MPLFVGASESYDTDAWEAYNLKKENAKLRKVANLISEYISYDRCDGCVVKTACNSHELDVCWMVTKLRNQLRELGVEVDVTDEQEEAEDKPSMRQDW